MCEFLCITDMVGVHISVVSAYKSGVGGLKIGEILRDGIASGRGVHRFLGVLIQKSRSLLGLKTRILRIFGICGVGVV